MQSKQRDECLMSVTYYKIVRVAINRDCLAYSVALSQGHFKQSSVHPYEKFTCINIILLTHIPQ
jgi:hypothetical protein